MVGLSGAGRMSGDVSRARGQLDSKPDFELDSELDQALADVVAIVVVL